MRSDALIRALRTAALAAAAGLAAASARSQQEPGTAGAGPLTDPRYEAIVVAEVGGVAITAQEFLLNYEFGPAFTKRRERSKLRHLDFMINEKLLALDGYARGLDTLGRTRDALAEIVGDLATEELYVEDVAGGVAIGEQEIADGIRRHRVSLALEWIHAPTEEGLARYHRMLAAGVRFDSVFAVHLRDGAKREDRSLRTTGFDLAMKNSVLARIVDSLAAGAVSIPIHVDDGWYIVRVAGRETSALSTQSEEAKMREDVHRALVQRSSDRLSDRYVNEVIAEAKPSIERRAFDIVQTHLAMRIVPGERFATWDMSALLAKKWGGVDPAEIEPLKGLALVTYRGGALSVGDFLRWYEARSTTIRLETGSARAFFASFEGMVWRMVRDKLLVERALSRSLDARPAVQRQRRWWEEKILYEMVKAELADSIPRDTASLKEYYARRAGDFRDGAGAVRPFESVVDDVRRAHYADALGERMLRRILSLKSRTTISIRGSVLDGLAPEAENAPRTIDVYAVKKGGTFPRPAFPSIDYGWQTWE